MRLTDQIDVMEKKAEEQVANIRELRGILDRNADIARALELMGKLSKDMDCGF